MKKTVYSIIGICLLIITISLTACKDSAISVPNIMGVGHSEAKTVLENAGFEVTEIEADASSILPNSTWNRTVKKGTVFKVNDVTYPQYNESSMNPKGSDKKVVIYYAVDDYFYEESDTTQKTTESKSTTTQKNTEPQSTEETVEWYPYYDTEIGEWVTGTVPPITNTSTNKPTTNTEWRQFLKDYEAWVDSYIVLLEKYSNNPSDPSILSDYMESLQKLAEWSEKAEKIEVDLQNDKEALKEYLETLSRILIKLSQVN